MIKNKKVKFFDKFLLIQYFKALSTISTTLSFVLIFIEIPKCLKLTFGFIFILLLIALYVILYIIANKYKRIELTLNNSKIEIFEGDIFDAKGNKIITFNEFFDTIVDNNIISTTSLNGKYILECYPKVSLLDKIIEKNEHAKKCIIGTSKRTQGKQNKYKLGTIVKNNDYFLLAFSKFDENNCAYLEIPDYLSCLINMWDECNILYAGQSISLPLLGSGITRFKNYENISDQELLELILWSLKLSKFRLKGFGKINIVLTSNTLDNISLFEIKNKFK